MRLTDELFVDITENFRTLSSIAREYECSPTAVSKMLSRYIKRNAPVFWGQVYKEYGLNGLRAKIDEFKKSNVQFQLLKSLYSKMDLEIILLNCQTGLTDLDFILQIEKQVKHITKIAKTTRFILNYSITKKIVRCDYELD